jgi:hypothetical protein
MKKFVSFTLAFVFLFLQGRTQQIKLNFAGNLNDSSVNHYLLDTNNCGTTLNFCADPSGVASNAYEYDGTCTMRTDSFSMTNTNYPGMSLSFYMSKNFDSDTIQYGLFHFYKGPFLVYAKHDSMFVTVTDSLNNNYTYGVPCNFPNHEWFCVVISFRDYGTVDFFFNKVKYTAGTTNYKILRRACEPGFCYWFSSSFQLWDNVPYKGKFDDVRVWNWPSDSVNATEICTKTIVPQSVSSFESSGAKVYPNPANDILILESTEKGDIMILDMMGRRLSTHTIEKGINRLNVASLTRGNYILLMQNSKGKYIERIIVE